MELYFSKGEGPGKKCRKMGLVPSERVIAG